MRYLLVLIILGAAGYFGYENYNLKKELDASQRELQQTKAELAKAEKQAKAVAGGVRAGVRAMAGQHEEFITKELVCTHCRGEGQYPVSTTSGRTRYAGCPMCGGTGKKMLRMPTTPGVKICPSCRGMGKLVIKGRGLSTSNRISTTMDRRCNGRGYLQASVAK